MGLLVVRGSHMLMQRRPGISRMSGGLVEMDQLGKPLVSRPGHPYGQSFDAEPLDKKVLAIRAMARYAQPQRVDRYSYSLGLRGSHSWA